VALYVVVHHRSAPEQPWSNAWLDDDRIEAITTTGEIGDLCAAAKARAEDVFVHRCAWGDPIICCAVRVASVDPLPRREALVRFTSHRVLHAVPPVTPHQGQNSYPAAPPQA
jgi:hypothetical protein